MLRRSILIATLFLAACGPSGTPHTRVLEKGANEAQKMFLLTNRDITINLAMPPQWKAMPIRDGDDLIARTSPRGAFGIAVYIPSIPDGEIPTDNPWRRGALETIEDSLKARAPTEYTWSGSTIGMLAGSPALQTTVRQKDGSIVRDTYFFHDTYLLTATAVSDDGEMHIVWPDIEQALAHMTFDGKEVL